MSETPASSTARYGKLEALSEDRCWQLLSQRQYGRLAVSIQGRPDIFPVNYRVDDETIVVKTAAGLKLAAATLGAGVAFEVDAIDELHHSGWSVVVVGTAVELENLDELLEADRLLLAPWAGDGKNRYVRIHPEQITGRHLPAD
ncbi:MAG: pyridoxamine 5'-phosphate oxidase family protein [Acidimicrobiia bacterium]|nr:pyridoxamine 5'-phosphate oxidase family protein [Acidimicrobiia bacterium]